MMIPNLIIKGLNATTKYFPHQGKGSNNKKFDLLYETDNFPSRKKVTFQDECGSSSKESKVSDGNVCFDDDECDGIQDLWSFISETDVISVDPRPYHEDAENEFSASVEEKDHEPVSVSPLSSPLPYFPEHYFVDLLDSSKYTITSSPINNYHYEPSPTNVTQVTETSTSLKDGCTVMQMIERSSPSSTTLQLCKLLPDMLDESSTLLTQYEKDILILFANHAVTHVKEIFDSEPHREHLLHTIRGFSSPLGELGDFNWKISTIENLFKNILHNIQFDEKILSSNIDLKVALYTCTLDILRSQLKNEDFKYPTIKDFDDVYGDVFNGETVEEKGKLWQFANWTFILFKVIGKKSIQELARDVIVKLLEGWHERYTSGGGKKQSTINRNRIVAVEVNKPLTLGSKKEKGTSSDNNNRSSKRDPSSSATGKRKADHHSLPAEDGTNYQRAPSEKSPQSSSSSQGNHRNYEAEDRAMGMHLTLLSDDPSNSAALPVDDVEQLIEQLQTICLDESFAEPSYPSEEQVDVLEQEGTFYLPQRSLVPTSLVTADGYSSMLSLEEEPRQFDHTGEKITYLDGHPTPRQGDNLHIRTTRSIPSSPSASPRSAWNPFKFGGDKNKKLLKAVQDADMDKVKKNLDKGADIESRDHVRYTPLILAASRGNAELVELLLSKGADIEASDMVGYTALLLAISRNYIEAVRILLEKKANIHAQNKDGKDGYDLAKSPAMKALLATHDPLQKGAASSSFTTTMIKEEKIAVDLSESSKLKTLTFEADPMEYKIALDIGGPTKMKSLVKSTDPDQALGPIHLESASRPAALNIQQSLFSNELTSTDLSSIPPQFICPISMEMMVDPVITTAGLTYERAYIEEWFRTGHTTDPMAHVPVADLLTTNIALKQQIEAFVTHSAVLQQHQKSEEDSKLVMQMRIDELTAQLRRIQMQQRHNDHTATPNISQAQEETDESQNQTGHNIFL